VIGVEANVIKMINAYKVLGRQPQVKICSENGR
jgi:hypothetical protein